MYDDLLAPDGLIATRLDYLFRTVHPHGRGRYSPREVADLINRAPGMGLIPVQSGTRLPSAGKSGAAVHAAGTLSGTLWPTARALGRPAEAGR
jgi:hypothetical protein